MLQGCDCCAGDIVSCHCNGFECALVIAGRAVLTHLIMAGIATLYDEQLYLFQL